MARFPKPFIWTPRHPEKYVGDVKNIVSRSSWETKAFNWCDMNPSILYWNSEEILVPYFNELDGKMHTYYVDLIIKVQTNSGIKIYLVEIKPECQVNRPIPSKRKTKKSEMRYLNEVDTYIKNIQKWKAAEEFANKRGWQFIKLTEKELNIK